MSWVEIEKALERLEQIESYTKEEQATLIASTIVEMVTLTPRESLVPFFKTMFLSNPDILDTMIDFTKSKLLKQYREAVKQARRQPRIRRR